MNKTSKHGKFRLLGTLLLGGITAGLTYLALPDTDLTFLPGPLQLFSQQYVKELWLSVYATDILLVGCLGWWLYDTFRFAFWLASSDDLADIAFVAGQAVQLCVLCFLSGLLVVGQSLWVSEYAHDWLMLGGDGRAYWDMLLGVLVTEFGTSLFLAMAFGIIAQRKVRA